MAKPGDKRFRDDINSLVREDTGRGSGRLPAPPGPNSDGPVVSRGIDAASGDGTGGGIASPLTETGPREYHDPQLLQSADGLFALVFQAVEVTIFTDAAGTEVKVIYGN